MKYTAQDESRVANIAQGEAKCYIICHKTLSNSNISSIGLYITFVMVTCFEASSDNCFTFSSAWRNCWLNHWIRYIARNAIDRKLM